MRWKPSNLATCDKMNFLLFQRVSIETTQEKYELHVILHMKITHMHISESKSMFSSFLHF